MADDMLAKRKQQEELNCSLCRRVWRYGKKREVLEERRAEKSSTRRRGTEEELAGERHRREPPERLPHGAILAHERRRAAGVEETWL